MPFKVINSQVHIPPARPTTALCIGTTCEEVTVPSQGERPAQPGRRGPSSQDENKDLSFSKRPVSKPPQQQRSALTEQLHAQEAEAEEEEDVELKIRFEVRADDRDRIAAEAEKWMKIALAQMGMGSSAASRTLAPSHDPETTEKLVYLPYGLMPRFHKSGVAGPLASIMRTFTTDGGNLDHAVEIICCGCAGVNHEAEAHCSMCRAHTLCKDCSVGIPKESIKWKTGWD